MSNLDPHTHAAMAIAQVLREHSGDNASRLDRDLSSIEKRLFSTDLQPDHLDSIVQEKDELEEEIMQLVLEAGEKLGGNKHMKLMQTVMNAKAQREKEKPILHHDDHKYYAAKAAMERDYELLEFVGDTGKQRKEMLNELHKVHERKYGQISREYEERHKSRKEAELKELKERVQDKWQKEQAKGELIRVSLKDTAIEELDTAIHKGGINDPKIEKALHKAEEELLDATRYAMKEHLEKEGALKEAERAKTYYEKMSRMLIVIFVLAAGLIGVLCYVYYAVSDGGHRSTQARKKGYERLGQGIRAYTKDNPVD